MYDNLPSSSRKRITGTVDDGGNGSCVSIAESGAVATPGAKLEGAMARPVSTPGVAVVLDPAADDGSVGAGCAVRWVHRCS